MFDLMAPAVYPLIGFDELPEEKRPALTFERAGLDVIEEWNIARASMESIVRAKIKVMEAEGEFQSFDKFKRNQLIISKERQRLAHEASEEPKGVEFEWKPPSEEDIEADYESHQWQRAMASIPNSWAHYLKVCECVNGARNIAISGAPIVWSELTEVQRKMVLQNMGSGNTATYNLIGLTNSIIAGIDAEGKPGFERIASDDGSSPTED